MSNILKWLKSFHQDTLTILGTNNSSQIATAVLAGFKIFFIPMATANDKKATPEQKRYTIARDRITEGLALTTYLGITHLVQKYTTAPICKNYYKNKAKNIESGQLKVAEQLTKEELDILKNIDMKKLNEIGMRFITEKTSNPKPISKEALEYSAKLDNIISKINGKPVEEKMLNLTDFVKSLSNNNVINENKGFLNTIKKGVSAITSGFSVLINDFKNAAKGSVEIADAKNLFKNTRISMSQVSIWVLALGVIPPLCNLIITPIMKKIKDKQEKNSPVEALKVSPQITTVNTQKDKNVKFERNYYNMTSLGNMRVR